MPIDMSNLALLCSSCGPTRGGYRLEDDGSKGRLCQKCGKVA
jgi:large subunit ribosomal protein L24